MSYLVIKCGGSVLEKLPGGFYKQLAGLSDQHNIQPIIVHGGGPSISEMLAKLQIETKFIKGLRVTTEAVLEVVEMVLSGKINKQIVKSLLEAGANGVGLSGVDGKLFEAKLVDHHEKVGLVGEIISVKKSLLESLLKDSYIPVISPISLDEKGRPLNVNADMAAAAIAKAFRAPLCLITDVPGVMKDGRVIPKLTEVEIMNYIQSGVISGGMIPKLQAAIACLKQEVKEVIIMNGLEADGLNKFAGHEAIGTSIVLEEEYIDA